MKYLLLVVFILTFGNVFSQDSFINYGLKAGLNISNIKEGSQFVFSEPMNYTSRYAFHTGVYLDVNIKKHFSIRNEILLSLQGARTSFLGFSSVENRNYMNMPVLFQYHLKRLNLYAGPMVGIQLNRPSMMPNVEFKPNFASRAIDVALCIGANYRIGKNWGVDIRYQNSIFQSSNFTPDGQERVFQAGFFYRLKSIN